MAAEELGKAGHSVILTDAMPSVGRKFLMAGKSGLNLTKSAPIEAFHAAYGADLPRALTEALDAFGPEQVMAWAEGLGQPLFTGSTGRVFPKAMKASPLLRAWMARLESYGVEARTKWRWTGWNDGALVFDTPDGAAQLRPKVTVLALGGASWARLGSNGAWSTLLPDVVAPFAPANMGFLVNWTDHMAPHFGAPVKSVGLAAGDTFTRGEFVITRNGIEGGGIYLVSRAMREGAPLTLDLMPDWSVEKLRAALAKPRGKASMTTHLRKVLRFDALRTALLYEFGKPFPDDLASLIKAVPVLHDGPKDMDEAISTAGGVRFDALTQDLMLKDKPGIFCAGEMIDWEAPTGGYLITACLATGKVAGSAAASFAQHQSGSLDSQEEPRHSQAGHLP